MPPFLPRKRLRSLSAEAESSEPVSKKAKGKAPAKTIKPTPRKSNLFEELDSIGRKGSAERRRNALEKLEAEASDDSDSSSISSLEDAELEDVPSTRRRQTKKEESDDEEDDNIEFEDVETNIAPQPGPAASENVSGDLELTLTKDTRVSITNPFGNKKGPSKIERGIRIATHQIHVQMLMYHNSVRNGWCCDKELQEVLVKQLPLGVKQKVEKWRRDSGLEVEVEAKGETPQAKGKGKASLKGKKSNPRSQRDWGAPAERLATGMVNMSRGDPLFKLLDLLIHYWRQRFRITAPGLRKLGYMSLARLDDEMRSFREDAHDQERHGERIRDIKAFRECGVKMEGSRDVASQLFTALLRGLGLEARLVANLQPLGFGWSQYEEATEKNPRMLKKKVATVAGDDQESSDNDEEQEVEDIVKASKKGKGKAPAKIKRSAKTASNSGRRSTRGNGAKDAPIDLSESEPVKEESSDESVVDVTPTNPNHRRSTPSLLYDKDLLYPHYWTEVLSPVTNTYTPVDPIVLNIVATNQEMLEKFEPRGAKSEKARQVTSYVIGHSSDGTAKEVTTRYLKRKVWPGRTKGYRFPIEKVPVYNKHGKVKHYEQKDWFKTVMSGYVRGSKMYPRTEIDGHEDITALKPAKAEKKVVEEGKETLQYFKTSKEFVLERHLKREEAIIPLAKHVRMFTVKGKGEEAAEEKVFLRKDVVHCKSMETWHKEGRAPIPGEEPLKRAPYRAATTNRRRELAEAEQASGEKVLQGLYSLHQTEWIIPPPIENGIIPKNNFGNIDLYVDSMLPQGAAHIPLRGTVKICKRLGIDYAEAVTGFEFGHRMAVPVITGVVVAEEHEEKIMDAWQKDEAERVRKEDEKARKAAIAMWRKMLMGLRIIERIGRDHGEIQGESNMESPFAKNISNDEERRAQARREAMDRHDEETAGGFLPEGMDVDDEEAEARFFPVTREEDENDDQGGGFVMEDDGADEGKVGGSIDDNGEDESFHATAGKAYPTPQSLESTTKPGSEEGEDISTRGELHVLGKKRARPSASATVTPKSKPNAKAPSKEPAKRAPGRKRKPSSKRAKCKSKVQDSEEDENEIQESDSPSLSELASDFEEEEVKPKMKAPGKRGRRATMPVVEISSASTRPRRRAARKSETALRSQYFEGGNEDEDDDS